MKHPRAKGSRNRLLCIRILESQGWKVGVVERTGKFITQKDLFGLFDLCAVKSPGRVLLVQVSSNKPHNHKRLQAFAGAYPDLLTRQYSWEDYKGFKVYQYGGLKWHLVRRKLTWGSAPTAEEG